MFEPDARLLSVNSFRSDRPVTLDVGDLSLPLSVIAANQGSNPQPEMLRLATSASLDTVTRAMVKVGQIEITGVDRYTDRSMTIGFSTAGFADALRRMAQTCGYVGPITRWLGAEVVPTTMASAEITRLHRALRQLGYYSAMQDGTVRPQTMEAIARWAADRGWSAPSELRKAHLDYMEGELRDRAAATEGAALVRRIQMALKTLGYYAGPVNGDSGGETAIAVARWAADRGWTAPSSLRPAHAEHMEGELASR